MAETKAPGRPVLLAALGLSTATCLLVVALTLGWIGKPRGNDNASEDERKERAEEKRPPGKTAYSRRLESLRVAIELGQVSEVEALLKGGASAGDRDDKGETPLMWAADKGHVNVCLLLLAKGPIRLIETNPDGRR